MNETSLQIKHPKESLYITDILGAKIILHGKQIGRLADMLITETDHQLPEVTILYIRRPYGDPSLLVPWGNVKVLGLDEIVIGLADDIEKYQGEPTEDSVLLKDHILDKKVLDIEGREVEIVYDIKLVLKNNKLFVSEANISRYRLLRRLRLKWFANLFYSIANKERDKKIPWQYIQPIPTTISSFKGDIKLKILKEKLSEIHPADLADILEELDRKQRLVIFNELDAPSASDTLEEIEPAVQRDIVSSLQKDKVAQLIDMMTPGQAADILSALPIPEVDAILELLKKENVQKIKAIIEKQEEKILNFATSKILKFLPDITAKTVQEEYHQMAKDKDVLTYLYVINQQDTLLGVIDLQELIQAPKEVQLKDIMTAPVITLNPESTLKEALDLFVHYEFKAIPIIDPNKKLLGAILYRDIMNLKHRFWE